LDTPTVLDNRISFGCINVPADPALNTCSGGRSASAHMEFWALDLEPIAAISRDQMVERLCPVYATRGHHAGNLRRATVVRAHD